MRRTRWRRLAAAAGAAGLVILLPFACDTRLTVRAYTVESDKVSAPVRLLALSDLHSCRYGENQRELVETALAQRPDAILLLGDIVDDELPEENAWQAVSDLAAACPCFYVTGNHEYWTGDAGHIYRQMTELGVTVLQGEAIRFTADSGQTLLLCGIDDPEFPGSARQLAEVGGASDGSAFRVLLAHRPDQIDRYLSYPFDLILSGHAHGGQWRIPGLINGIYSPDQGLFPPYAGGRYDFEESTLIVSRGLARESTRVPRIFNPPELVVVDVMP